MVVTAPARKRRTVLTVSPTACLPTRRSCQPTHVCQRQVQLGAPGDPGTAQTIRCERARARVCVCVFGGVCRHVARWPVVASRGRPRQGAGRPLDGGRSARAGSDREEPPPIQGRAGPGPLSVSHHATAAADLPSLPLPRPDTQSGSVAMDVYCGHQSMAAGGWRHTHPRLTQHRPRRAGDSVRRPRRKLSPNRKHVPAFTRRH